MIGAHYKGRLVSVRPAPATNSFFIVSLIKGKPFRKWGMDGFYEDNWTLVHKRYLEDVKRTTKGEIDAKN
jgi:hypothetical protein